MLNQTFMKEFFHKKTVLEFLLQNRFFFSFVEKPSHADLVYFLLNFQYLIQSSFEPFFAWPTAALMVALFQILLYFCNQSPHSSMLICQRENRRGYFTVFLLIFNEHLGYFVLVSLFWGLKNCSRFEVWRFRAFDTQLHSICIFLVVLLQTFRTCHLLQLIFHVSNQLSLCHFSHN